MCGWKNVAAVERQAIAKENALKRKVEETEADRDRYKRMFEDLQQQVSFIKIKLALWAVASFFYSKNVI